MLDKSLLTRVLDEALKKGADFAEIYVEEKQVSNIVCEEDRIDKVFSGREQGAGIRAVKDGRTSYIYTNDLSEQGLLEAGKRAAHVAAEDGNTQAISLQKKLAPYQMECKRLPASIAFDEKIETVLQANQAARDISKEIRQVTVVAGDLFKHVQIANSEGELIEDQRSRVRLAVNVVAAREGIIQTGFESVGGVCGWELLEQVDFPELGKKAAQLAVNMLDARPAPAGKMPVVISSDAGGTMVHEACGHGLEADLVQKGLSVYRDRLGQMVAAPGVTVIDDATLEGKYGSFVFDDEATVGQRTVLIENGELKHYMYDRLTAARDNQELTGNGRRESYQHKPVPRMSNTFIAPGPDEPDDIIRSTEKGLFVKKMGGGQVNTTNGDFVFDVQEAYIIENGELKYPVRGATLTGNGPAALANIDRVGKDLGFGIGVCGKEGQGVSVSDAQPTIRIKEMTVGGMAAGSQNCHPVIKRM